MDDFYRAFEDRHRGSRDVIKSRLRVYLPFVRPLVSASHDPVALDLGCGRGEWLELLSEHGFRARGVDLDAGMLAACRERGLDAIQADAITTLRSLDASSVAVVSAFHVVEHIPFEAARELIRESLRVLHPGGLLILETPNPENLVVGTSLFYQDPSHVNPIPPELLSFAVEHAGFPRVKTVRLQEDPLLLDEARPPGLFHVLSGVSPDYSVVAQKDAPPATLELFEAAFNTEHGLTLPSLSARYDDLANRREAVLRALLSEAEKRLAQSDAGLAQSIAQLDSRLCQAETSASRAEEHAAALYQQLNAVLHSRSWRMTAPLRYAGHQARRVRSAFRENRVKSGTLRRIRPALKAMAHAASNRPYLSKPLLALLARFPSFKRRLHDALKEPPKTIAPPAPLGLSPRSARLLGKLKRSIESKRL
ncbi:MAG: hypothetical protein K0S28_86 [Paucimonas sp.]|nr:hypothetical protein [Paucimonas sp.]